MNFSLELDAWYIRLYCLSREDLKQHKTASWKTAFPPPLRQHQVSQGRWEPGSPSFLPDVIPPLFPYCDAMGSAQSFSWKDLAQNSLSKPALLILLSLRVVRLHLYKFFDSGVLIRIFYFLSPITGFKRAILFDSLVPILSPFHEPIDYFFLLQILHRNIFHI